ncbi:MFS transporter [Paraburkholderia sp. Ac-20342]|uniref:MFS transporter n=1 Tax=Paraburkholderia sp. Ac-20342 TaxID=2703889 RepID=UPI00197F109A|nr:MFS transporter [Paraburkholderia sp. Ac-20342]MBN3846274.1 MFS transporter [Paraburkholderia sp. Ac-20342]
MAETKPFATVIDARPIGGFQIAIAAIGALALFCEGFDLQIISYVMPHIVEAWRIEPARQGAILSAGYSGMLIGFLVLAPLASKIGAKRLAVCCLFVMGVLNFVTLLASDAQTLVFCRIAVGLTLGGVVPPTLALVSEFFPARHRSALIAMLYLGTTSGIMIAGVAAWATLSRYGWRGAMAIGGVMPIVVALAVWCVWCESPVWLLSRGPKESSRVKDILARLYPRTPLSDVLISVEPPAPRAGGVAQLFVEKRLVGTLMLWVALSFNAVVYFFALSWMPLILVKIGATQQDAIFASTLGNLGGIAAIATGFLMDRFGSARVVTAYFLMGAAFVLLLGTLLSPAVVVIAPAAFCLGYCVSGLQKGVSALAIEFYPPALRSTGLGWVLGIGRSGAILGPMIPGFLMQAGWPPAHVFYLMAVPLVLGGAGIALMRAWYRQRSLPEQMQIHVSPSIHDDYPRQSKGTTMR